MSLPRETDVVAGGLELQPRLMLASRAAFQAVPRLATTLTGATRVSILFLSADRVWPAATQGAEVGVGQFQRLNEGLLTEVRDTGRAILIPDLRDSPYQYYPERGYKSWSCMAAPIICDDRMHAIICAADPAHASAFRPEDLSALQLLAEHLTSTLDTVIAATGGDTIDSLTGLCTPRAFREHLDGEVERTARTGRPLSVLVLGLSHPDGSNEMTRRRPWQQDLLEVSRVLLQTVRNIDLVARYGRQEFAIMLPETSADQSYIVGNRVMRAVGDMLSRRKIPYVPVELSCGLATMPPAIGSDQLLDRAFTAMHSARTERVWIRHSDMAHGQARSGSYACTCQACGRAFRVATAEEWQARRYCSRSCAAVSRRTAKSDRNRSIQAMRDEGMSLRALAEQFGISIERVRQICEAAPLGLMNGAAAAK